MTNAIIFPATKITTTSAAISATLTNHESQSETFTIGVSCPFTATSNCRGGVIAAQSSCTIVTNFVPTVSGPNTGGVTITHTAVNGSPLGTALSGSGVTTNPAGAVAVVSPGAGTVGSTVNAIITGNGWTNFDATSTINFLTQGLNTACVSVTATISNTATTTANTIAAQIQIAANAVPGGCDIQVVTGSETDFLSAAFIVADSTNSHIITSVTSNFGTQGQNLNVNLLATGTSFQNGITYANFGSGIQVNSLNVSSATTAQANITISNTACVGFNSITLVAGGETSTLSNAFAVRGATPYLASVTPSIGQQTQTLNVTFNGVFTNFVTGQVLVNLGGDIQVNSYNVTSPTSMTANITVTLDAVVGGRTGFLTVGPSCNQSIFPFGFTVTPSAAQIVSVTPSSVPQGGQVTLTIVGANTHWVQGTTNAAFYNIPAGFISVPLVTIIDATHATLNIAVSANHPVGGHAFYLATGGEVVSSSISVYANTPTLNVSPANGIQGTSFSVSFTGAFTHFGTTTLPVVNGQGVTLSNFVVNSPVSATGTITIAQGAPYGLCPFTFTTGGEIVTTGFNVTNNAAYLYSITPYQSQQNTRLNVVILGVNTHFVAGTTIVNFDPSIAVNSTTVTDGTHVGVNITVAANAFIGWHTAYVNTGAEQVIIGYYVYGPASPTILGVVPGSGPQGSTQNVTITGSLTHWVQGTTNAILGAGVTVSNLQITSPTTATATISVSPTAPVGGNTVVMITGTEIESGSGFSVTPNASLIQSVLAVCADANYANNIQGQTCTPPSGPPVISQLQTVSLAVTCVGTHWLQGDSTFSFGANVATAKLTVYSPTSANVQITLLSGAPIGFTALTTTTDGEVISLQQAIDIEQGFAKLHSTIPGGGVQGVTLNLQVLGQFTHWVQGVTSAAFNQDITVNSFTVIDNVNAIANITVSPLAYVDNTCNPSGHTITITTGAEQVSIPGSFCLGRSGAQVTKVYPSIGAQGTTLSVTVTGSGTNWVNGITTANFGSGITVSTFQVSNSTTINAVIDIDPAAQNGYRTVFVQAGSQGLASNFQVYTPPPPVPYIPYFWPTSGLPGPTFTVRLTGQNTHWDPVTRTANFGNNVTINTFQVLGPGSAIANISIDPAAPASNNVVTLITGTEIVTTGFNVVVSVPTLSIVDPGSALQGANNANVNIIGQYTVFDKTTTFNFGQGITVSSVTVLGPTIATASINIAQFAQLGGRGVTATTGGLTIGGAGFTVTPSLALISAISPNTALAGQTVTVDVQGQNTHWSLATVFTFGDGIMVTYAVVNSPTDATVTISIPPLAGEGATGATAVTAGEVASIINAFVDQPGAPYLLSSGSSSVPQQGTVTFTILSQATTWTTTPPTVSYGPGIVLPNTNVTGDTSLTVTGFAQPTTPVGYRNLSVMAGLQTLTLPYAVYVAPVRPSSTASRRRRQGRESTSQL